MKKRLIIAGVISIIIGLIISFALLVYLIYPLLEAKYQRDMDVVRRNDAHQIAKIIREFGNKTGHLPFQDEANEKPFMVLIGHSPEEENHFANDPVLIREGQWANSSALKSLLEKELGKKIQLPRDPQIVPTYAPNVYIYFVSGNQMSVMSHLHNPDEKAIKYEWNGKTFYSYTLTYNFAPPPQDSGGREEEEEQSFDN